MDLTFDEQTLEKCTYAISELFGIAMPFGAKENRWLSECLSLAGGVDSLLENAKRSKEEGKATFPALKKRLRKLDSDVKQDSQEKITLGFAIEENGQYAFATPSDGYEDQKADEVLSAHYENVTEKIIEDTPEISIDDAFQDYLKSLYPYQNLLIDDLSKFGIDDVTRLTVFNPPTSTGKTYMIPAIAYLAHQNGCKLIYSCSTRASIREVYAEFVSDNMPALRDYYTRRDTKTGSRKLLLIPSIRDGYENFFRSVFSVKRSKNDDVEISFRDIYLPECTKEDVEALRNFLLEYDNDRGNSMPHGGNAFDNATSNLRLLSDEKIKDAALKQDVEKRFNFAASEIKKILHIKYCSILDEVKKQNADADETEQRIIAKREMLSEYPWVGKLYPGFLFDFAEVVLMTNNKLTKVIDPIGINRGTMTAPEIGVNKNHWVLVDEVDQFCDNLSGDSVDRSMRVMTDIKELLSVIITRSLFAMLRYDNKNPDQSVLTMDTHMLPANDAKKEVLRKEVISLWQQAEALDEKYCHCFTRNSAMKYVADIDADGKIRIPTMVVDNTSVHIISSGTQKIKEGMTKHFVLRESSADNQLRILEIEVPEGKDISDELLYTEWCKDASALFQKFLVVVRQLCVNMDAKSHGGYSQDYIQKIFCKRLGFSESQSKYVRENLLQYWSTAVKWDHFYAYGFTWNLMDTSNPLQTEINIVSCNELPDYLFANLVLNSKKTILCSATAGMKSLSMPDIRYTVDAIAKHLDDANERNLECKKKMLEESGTPKEIIDQIESIPKADPDTLIYTMQSIREVSAMLKEKREKEYRDNDVLEVFELYDRSPKSASKRKVGKYLADVAHYEEITGLKLSIEDQNSYSIGNLAFACHAIESMLKNGLHSAIVYSSRLPKSEENYVGADDCYSLQRCEIAKNAIIEKLGLNNITFRIEKLDAGAEKKIEKKADEYVLLLSAYASTGAGSNITVINEFTDGTKAPETDLSGVYCDDVTNVIPGPKESDDWDARTRTGMLCTYGVKKSGELMSQIGTLEKDKCLKAANKALYYKAPNGNRSILSICLTPGMSGMFKKDIFADEDFSPLKETMRKMVLQAVNRIERGHIGEKQILICMSSTLIENACISKDAYKNVSYPGHLFEYALNHIAELRKESAPTVLTELDKLNRIFVDKNIYNRKFIVKLMRDIEKGKKEGNLSPVLINLYKYIRKIAFAGSCGNCADLNNLYFAMTADCDELAFTYAVQRGFSENCNGDEQIDNARLYLINEAKNPINISDTPDKLGPYGVLRYMEDQNWLGDEWKKFFVEVLPYIDDLRTHGYKYLPYVNTHTINVGEIYERMFRSVSCPGGVYNVGYEVIPYDEDLLEDFDFKYKDTHVVIDVKGYTMNGKPTKKDRLPIKIERYRKKYGCEPIILFINMMSGHNVNNEIEQFKHFTYINSFSDMSMTRSENEIKFTERRNYIRALCDENRF